MNRRPSAPASQAMQLRRGVLYPTAFLTPDAPIPRDTTDDDPLMADLPMLSVRAAAPGIHTSLLRAPPPLYGSHMLSNSPREPSMQARYLVVVLYFRLRHH